VVDPTAPVEELMMMMANASTIFRTKVLVLLFYHYFI
jgi:hypothetical protein